MVHNSLAYATQRPDSVQAAPSADDQRGPSRAGSLNDSLSWVSGWLGQCRLFVYYLADLDNLGFEHGAALGVGPVHDMDQLK